jgi:hypothetical protein
MPKAYLLDLRERGCRLCRGRPVATRRCGALSGVGVLCGEPDEGGSHAGSFAPKPRGGRRQVPTRKPGDILICDNLRAHKSVTPGSSLGRPTVSASMPSRWLSPSSKRSCAPERSALSTPGGAPSAKSATSSVHTNCQNYFALAGYGLT